MASTNSSFDLDGALSPSDLENFEENRLKSPQAHVQPIGRFLEELAQSSFPGEWDLLILKSRGPLQCYHVFTAKFSCSTKEWTHLDSVINLLFEV